MSLDSFSQPVSSIHGIGPSTSEQLEKKGIFTVKDLLLFLPLRYEDRSEKCRIQDALLHRGFAGRVEFRIGEMVTVVGKVVSTNNYYRGRRSIQSASIEDETGKLKLMWFNNPWVIKKLEKGKEYYFSGKINDRKILMQATVEEIKEDTIHTGRLVPIYSSLGNIKQGTLRRILKRIVNTMLETRNKKKETKKEKLLVCNFLPFGFSEALAQLHFPDSAEKIIQAREQLALEELLSLMQYSKKIKESWKSSRSNVQIAYTRSEMMPDSIPFELTKAQQKATQEILEDLKSEIPMNRLLIGDVGSGKTVVAGIACYHIVKNGHNACIVAPTQILAEQHYETFKKLFPELNIELVTAVKKSPPMGEKLKSRQRRDVRREGEVFIGTHALINKFTEINPGLIIFDEQHRFGVAQRTYKQTHMLTMSATPIPRSLMLTIFSHLKLSVIDEMPPGRKPVKTWAIPNNKREEAYNWILTKQTSIRNSELEIRNSKMLILVVCPFIEPSQIPGFEHIASAKQTYEEINNLQHTTNNKLLIEILHGKLTQKQKDRVSKLLSKQKIDILVTTPVIEVGLDVPNADIIVIESAQRFGMASLHQIRGRVGRRGQDSYCIAIQSNDAQSQSKKINPRLNDFAKENNGMKLAELDLKRRGAGDIFGTEQSGLDQLRFANWTNLELISKARKIFDEIEKNKVDWKPFIEIKSDKNNKSIAPN